MLQQMQQVDPNNEDHVDNLLKKVMDKMQKKRIKVEIPLYNNYNTEAVISDQKQVYDMIEGSLKRN